MLNFCKNLKNFEVVLLVTIRCQDNSFQRISFDEKTIEHFEKKANYLQQVKKWHLI